MKCPNCKKEFKPHKEKYRPFCSERCKEIDLGQWFSESYSVPAVNLNEDEVEELSKIIEEKDYND